MKNIEELRKLDDKKLKEELDKSMQDLTKVTFEVKTGHEKNHRKIKSLKQQVARIKTLITERGVKKTEKAEEEKEKIK